VFEKRLLRRMFRPKREEAKGGWRKFHKEELHNLSTLPNALRLISGMKWSGGEGEESRNEYKIVV
jgi:hypothetical protein